MANPSVSVVLGGQPFHFWKSFNASRSMDAVAGAARLTASEAPNDPLPVFKGQTAQILLHGIPFVTGHVHSLQGDSEWESHDIEFEVKDKTEDLRESQLGPNAQFKTPITPKKLAEETIKFLGMSGVRVIDNIGLMPFEKGEFPVSDIGDTGLGFLEPWMRKRQALMIPDGKGNIVLDRNQRKRGARSFYRGFEDSRQNNVLKSGISVTDEGQFNATAANGQKSGNDAQFWEGLPKGDEKGRAGNMATAWGLATDTSVRPSRRAFIRNDKGMQGQTPEQTARWHSNVARSKGFIYRCVVNGWLDSEGQLLEPNRIHSIVDKQWKVEMDMLLKSVSFSEDFEGGEIAQLEFCVEDAFTLEPSASVAAQRSGGQGLGNTKTGSNPVAVPSLRAHRPLNASVSDFGEVVAP